MAIEKADTRIDQSTDNELPPRPRGRLAASPAMRTRLGLVEPVAPAPDADSTLSPQPAAPDPEQKVQRLAVVRALEALLRERWPVVFCVPRVPLAIGLHRQILEAAGTEVDAAQLSRFLAWWVRRWDYLDAVAHGEPRRNLDGSVAGEPDEQQQKAAAIQVYGSRAEAVLARIKARRAAEMEMAP